MNMIYCKVLSQVMKKAQRIYYDKQILESDSEVKISWRGSKDSWVFSKIVSMVGRLIIHD